MFSGEAGCTWHLRTSIKTFNAADICAYVLCVRIVLPCALVLSAPLLLVGIGDVAQDKTAGQHMVWLGHAIHACMYNVAERASTVGSWVTDASHHVDYHTVPPHTARTKLSYRDAVASSTIWYSTASEEHNYRCHMVPVPIKKQMADLCCTLQNEYLPHSHKHPGVQCDYNLY